MTPEESMREYLTTIAYLLETAQRPKNFLFGTHEELMLKLGTPFKPRELPKEIKPGFPKACYQNAFNLAARSRGKLRYCEGFAMGIIPVMHAWCLDRDNFVVDPTWYGCSKLHAPLGECYWGVALKLDFVRKIQRESGLFGLLDNYKARFPLLTCSSDEWLEAKKGVA